MFLGSPRLEYAGSVIKFTRRKALALLCYLAVNDWPCSRDVLAGIFWPECNDRRARAGLRQVLFTLNETPVAEWIESDRDLISLRRDARLWIDAVRFNALVDAPPQVQTLSEAVELYRDNFLAGFTLRDSPEFDNWQSLQTQIFQQKLIGAIEALVALQIEAGNPEKALQAVHRWLMIDVLHEPAQRQFMRLCAATGQRAAALRQFETYSELLREELGLRPSVEMVHLYEAVKRNEPIQLEEQRADAHSILPALPRIVVGRAAAADDLKRRLLAKDRLRPAVTVIQGWPGIGKTTLVSLLAHDPALHAHFADGVLFASLGEHPNLLAELLNWAYALGIADVHHLDSVDALSQRLAAVLRDRRMLLIVDDVWEAHHAAPFNVGGHDCASLITTRMNDVARQLIAQPEDIYKIDILTEATAVSLLQMLAPQVVEQNPDEAVELIRALEGLPLAIQVAGRLLNTELSLGWGVVDLLQDLREGTVLLDAEVMPDQALPDRETPPTIRVLLQRSTDRLDLETRKRFALLGAFAPKPATFDLAAMQAVWRVTNPRPTVRTLVARGLLEPINAGNFQIHALLVMHARSMFGE